MQVQVKSQVISLQVKSQIISLQVQVKSQVTKIVTRVRLESKSHDSSQHLWREGKEEGRGEEGGEREREGEKEGRGEEGGEREREEGGA